MSDERPEAVELLANIKAALPRLRELWELNTSQWNYEDPIYRFYHQSYKVYRLQAQTTAIVGVLAGLAPQTPAQLNAWFMSIIIEGTGKQFNITHNQRWLAETRPIVEAYFHARFMLEMVLKCAEMEGPPSMLPSGWATVLYLYGLR